MTPLIAYIESIPLLTACGTLCSVNHLLGPLWVRPPSLLLRLAMTCDYLVFDSEVPAPGLYYFDIFFIVLRVPNSTPASSTNNLSLQRTTTIENFIYAHALLITLVNGVSSGPLCETLLTDRFSALRSIFTLAHPLL